jgi:hypothetical protein
MTESTIHDRHMRRRERTLAHQRAKGIAPFVHRASHESRPDSLQLFPQLPEWETDTMFTREVSMPVSPCLSLPQILIASALGGASSEVLVGRPGQPPKLSRYLHSSIIAQSSSNTLILHQQQETIVRNHQRLGRVAMTAGSTSLLFGTKYGIASYNSNTSTFAGDNDVFSSAVAGTAIATLYTPLENVNRQMATYRVINFTDAAISLFRTQSLFANARHVYFREIAGAVVYFGTYASMKQLLGGKESSSSSAAVLVSGGTAGALYRSLTYTVEYGTSRGLAMRLIRAFPAHAISFWGYETMISLTTTRRP